MHSRPTAAIVIPTKDRPDYLAVALETVVPQAEAEGAEIIVVDDSPAGTATSVAERFGARVVATPRPGGLNRARNAGVAAARSDLIILIDDDVAAPPGWLAAILAGAVGSPDVDAFGGPIRARLEGGGPRSCGREDAPITTLDLGPADREVDLVWGANMAIRRRAFDRAGLFDESLSGPGDEEDWERRYRASGGLIRYLAAAGLEHRRSAADATLRSLSRAAYRQGRASRRYDFRKGSAPSIRAEMRTLVGCQWHIMRRRCANGIVLTAHSAGRLREALAPRRTQVPQLTVVAESTDDFFSGTSGQLAGMRATTRALTRDAAADAVDLALLTPWRLRRAAHDWPRRRILVLAVERLDVPNVLDDAQTELEHSHHDVEIATAPVGSRGKFENLNDLLIEHPAAGHDWLLLIDDDVALPRPFLDVFVFLAERFDLALAQPAHRWRSHAAWRVTRRRPGALVRQTRFVEIGPVSALRADTFETLLPFPPLRFGWGLDLHWSALAQAHGWRQGIIDATPVRHGLRQIATSYDRSEAVAETRQFLADRPYTPATAAQQTLAVHRHW